MGVVKKFYITKFKEERPKIELKNISLSFNKRQILDNISLTIREGEICGLLGPNGVGISTIINIIIGLLSPDYGEVFINKKKGRYCATSYVPPTKYAKEEAPPPTPSGIYTHSKALPVLMHLFIPCVCCVYGART